MTSFERVLQVELEVYKQAIVDEMNRQVFGWYLWQADRHRRGWPEQYGVIPGWLPVSRRWRRARTKVRRFRYEVSSRCGLAWRALKGEDLGY